MARLPKPREVIRVALRLGFALSRQRGSHAIYRNAEGKRITVPIHGSRELGPALFKQVLKDLDISRVEFWEYTQLDVYGGGGAAHVDRVVHNAVL